MGKVIAFVLLMILLVSSTDAADSATAIAGGEFHTCALTAAGGVKCWGRNLNGQLGDNTTTARTTPVDVSGLSSGIVAITAGGSHSCALTVAGGVKCWGRNFDGELGDDSRTDRHTPVDVVGLTSGVAAISAGGSHTCALTTAGGLKCWGNSYYGQLGSSSTANVYGSSTPVDVLGMITGVSAIAAGEDVHTCALTTAGGVKCWGRNHKGQLGDGSTADRNTPVDVIGLAGGVVAVSAGFSQTCALTAVGSVKCWGDGIMPSFTPAEVSGLGSGAAAIGAGSAHACALTTAGGVKCWGYGGNLGDGKNLESASAVDVEGLTGGVKAIAAGTWHTCALTTAGGVKCWARNDYGQLGDGTTIGRHSPVDVSGLSGGGVSSMTYQLSVAISGSGSGSVSSSPAGIDCGTSCIASYTSGASVTLTANPAPGSSFAGWTGACTNTTGACSLSVTAATSVTALFVLVPSAVSSAAALSAGDSHTCAVTSTGGVKCWGRNDYGGLGDNTTTGRTAPVDVWGLSGGVKAVAAGDDHSCALTTAGGVKCWGRNFTGQLGYNNWTDYATPVDVSGLASGVAAISAGGSHNCALTATGGLKCWGNNFSGQLGDASTTQRTAPTDVSGLGSGVSAVSGGDSHTCALTNGGGVKCWGNNDSGQLGNGTTTSRSSPGDVSGLTTGITAIAAGDVHTCALTSTGGVKCWGYAGMSGDIGSLASLTPADVPTLSSGVTAIAAGGGHACALTTGGGVKCWGYNINGQVGDGSTNFRATPVDVTNLNSGITAIAAGAWHNCALSATGGIKCWGKNDNGQLGNGSTSTATTPVATSGLAGSAASSVTYRLTVANSGSGYGNVSSSPAGISCYVPQPGYAYLVAPDCSEAYASGTSVTLTATPSSGSVFIGWTGDCTGTSTCKVSVSAAINVTANFISTSTTAGADCLFNWAERVLPRYFAPAGVESTFSAPYYWRYYKTTENFLITSSVDNHFYALGRDTGSVVLDLGPITDFLNNAGCSP